MKKIDLSNGFKVLVDDSDFEYLNKFRWYRRVNRSGNTYVFRIQDTKTTLYIHREIMNPSKGKDIDHINGNGLDNRRENLRVCNRSQNTFYSKKRKTLTSSIYKGVCWSKKHKIWISKLFFNGKAKHIGFFEKEIEAAKAYNRFAFKLGGQYAKLNFIKE